ncbi:hypothetical protein [Nonomuraea angiospora]|uniref:hypothetical protein n=1 Tax=Nonomuraea angiospora TaxID=46172 RepID=UPI0029BB875E|nr:hypothetical protein [Nonomuraea angiospora]MDX3100476.1 hypothetical protein [Nonomuraea angiospora]
MTEPAALAQARALAVIDAADSPAETRRALEGKPSIRAYAASLDTTPDRVVTDLLDWLAANPAVLEARTTYIDAAAMDRLCRVLGVAAPERLPQARDEALVRLAEATGTPELQLRERLHRQATDRYRRLREEFVESADAATLEAVIKRVQDSQALWAANRANLRAGR